MNSKVNHIEQLKRFLANWMARQMNRFPVAVQKWIWVGMGVIYLVVLLYLVTRQLHHR